QISFSLANSTVQTFVGAQRVYESTVAYPGGYANGATYVTVSANASTTLVANTLLPNGVPFQWSQVFNNYTGIRYVTVFNGSQVNIRLVQSIISNTVIQVSEPFTFSNTTAKFLISPVGTVDGLDVNSPTGKRNEFLRLIGSNANSSVRFVNNVIETISLTAGGTGYSNNDVMYITGFE